MHAHVYTRVEGSLPVAGFLCARRDCMGAADGRPTAVLSDDRELLDECVYCGEKRRAQGRRR